MERTALMDNFWIWIVALLLCMPLRSIAENTADKIAGKLGVVGNTTLAMGRAAVSVVLLVACVALLVGATNNPFIYTRF